MNKWHILGKTVTGASHLLQGKPRQDAFQFFSDPFSRYHILSIADGHGSEKCPHSDEGAQIAVETATTLLSDIIRVYPMQESFSLLGTLKEIWLPKQLEAQWKENVQTLHTLKEREVTDPFPYLLYGTTLATLVIADDFIFILQIGDGDVVLVGENKPVKWLIEPEYLDGNRTHSLCMEQSWQHIRAAVFPDIADSGEVMILMATDGYANCFTEQTGFPKACTDIFALWRKNGIEFIQDNLENWLIDSSINGSGDDITMVLALR